MNTGETIALIKAFGKGGGGSSLPSVTSADNGKVLAVKDGAWEGGFVRQEVISDGAQYIPVSYDGTSFSTTITPKDLNEGYTVTIDGNTVVCPPIEYSTYTLILFTVAGSIVGSMRANIHRIGGGEYEFVTAYVDISGLGYAGELGSFTLLSAGYESLYEVEFTHFPKGGKFLVTLTPTSPDYSGTMDKTVAEINAAYEAGQELVFRVMQSATDYMDVDCTARWHTSATYPSFNGFVVTDNDVLLYAYTGATNNGTKQTYSTVIYPLTPAS